LPKTARERRSGSSATDAVERATLLPSAPAHNFAAQCAVGKRGRMPDTCWEAEGV